MLEHEKKKLPEQGILDIDFAEESFTLFAKRLITNLEVTIFIHHKADLRAKMNIQITQVFPPGEINAAISSRLLSSNNPDQNASIGFVRAIESMNNELLKKIWLLHGKTTKGPERYICIIVLPNITASYAFKPLMQSEKSFNPALN